MKMNLMKASKNLSEKQLDLFLQTSPTPNILDINKDKNYVSLEFLASEKLLSVRSVNICRSQGLTSLKSILDYYKNNGSFVTIKNCGKLSEDELVEFCKGFIYQNRIIEQSTKLSILDQIGLLNPFQKSILNRHLEYLVSKLSVRAYNGLCSISESLNPKEVFDKIFLSNFKFKSIKNIGNKSIAELDHLKSEIQSLNEILLTLKEEQLTVEYIKLILKTNFANLPENFNQNFETTVDVNGKIKLFTLIKILIDSDQLFNKNEKIIFLDNYSNLSKHNSTLESIASELLLTRERVRQIKMKLEDNIESYFSFILSFTIHDFINYEIDISDNFQTIDQLLADKINENENVSFNISFYSIILRMFFEKSHYVLGDDETLTGKRKSSYSKNFQNCYIISKSLHESFSYASFIEDINSKLTDRITETYSLHFEGYLFQFLLTPAKQLLPEIRKTCEKIIFEEFELLITTDGYLTFERNKFKPHCEYIIETLEEADRMMKVEEISNIINSKYPEVEIEDQSIRSIVQREKELFIYIGRSSTYGLRKWEQQKVNLKGGTIREIVEEFLKQEETPKHISEILEYVLRFRDTNEKNVLTNIRLEENNRFKFYEGDFVGLKDKKYPIESINFKRAVGSHFRIALFEKMNGWELEKVIDNYVYQFGYKDVQVKFIIQQKINEGKLKLSADNKISI